MEYEKVIIETSKSIYRYLLKIGVTPAEAEDIVQDTIHKALVSIPNMKITYIKTWLFQVAINRHRDLARRQQRIEQIPIESVQLIGAKGLDEPLLRKELQVEIQSILGKMNPIYKHILLLKYDYELSYKEIATVLEMKEDTVRVSLYRARNEFKKLYRRLEDEQR
ncbi:MULTISPECIES: RNA polymerase sigma factor [Bacillus]|uniref:RNA polymerase sigma factor n=2 Tax=Bacillus cereus group TaxID=86661 RepID=A0A2A7D556_BACAN|nr:MULTISPECIES: RNA polymerase sigma factor [Bacillus]MCP1165996.1 RNA polymerase sigma factor [Bacillus sp. 1813sda1]OTW68651.1 RNA polymerase subunit sigma-70 [Bacillus thuringiensis serovar coreanensis]OTX42033.1 RNA polymerase subunit sigma-70 [Bacillus thuringiensis serovar sooncheon]OTX51257.1 RNA polymerase subunit sigma-70 [Bacillus thuringiensis serovar guiyangiensis]OTX66236.1 RNA polymerase subunit sigma-70 [Bacillus thuringiensis serovar roskildiensis]